MTTARYHSVILDEDACKGCTVCVTTCPVEAIRVRDGKARILGERCIDCGECIKRCPHHAKQALIDDFSLFMNPKRDSPFDYRIALPAPSLYGQFSEKYSIEQIHQGLLSLGFDAVYPVSAVTTAVSAAARAFLDKKRYPDLPRPLISSSCPTIIKFIQIRFPSLLDHIVPVIAPMEIAAILAKNAAKERLAEKPNLRIGCYFISPCSGKITEAFAPLNGKHSAVDGVFAIKDVYLALIKTIGSGENHKKNAESVQTPPRDSADIPVFAPEIAWGRVGGEAASTVTSKEITTLSVDGMDQCRKILEAVEDGSLRHIDFLELMACQEGCVGGPLVAINAPLARHNLIQRELKTPIDSSHGISRVKRESDAPACVLIETFHARPALLLDKNYRTAMRMMVEMETIYESLPGLDCGCCGAPNCHALAEDIVRGVAKREDCVIILKEQYLRLLEDGKTIES